MSILSTLLVTFVALEHLYILYLEMFAISSDSAKRSFGLDDAFLNQPKVRVMFANQGLYNGFLAVGLLLSAFALPTDFRYMASLYFIGCVIVAAVYGAMTSSKKILLMQGTPAILALLSLLVFQ